MRLTGSDFKSLSKSRLKTVDILNDNEEWGVAKYIMGYVLELAMKAMICQTLGLPAYPHDNKDEKTASYFKTHVFDRLLVVSGATKIFKPDIANEASFNWEQFTKEYPGDWSSVIRYDPALARPATPELKSSVQNLYTYLVGILKTIEEKKLW